MGHYSEQYEHDEAINYWRKMIKHGVFIENPKCKICGDNITHEWLDGDYSLLMCGKDECWEKLDNLEKQNKNRILIK